jgi:hypothetical protein
MDCPNCKKMMKALRKIEKESRTSVWTYGGGDPTWEARLARETLEGVAKQTKRRAKEG